MREIRREAAQLFLQLQTNGVSLENIRDGLWWVGHKGTKVPRVPPQYTASAAAKCHRIVQELAAKELEAQEGQEKTPS
jgi:hypothetical protein